jgi:hypothetical protein
MPSRLEIIGFGITGLCLTLAVFNLAKALIANSRFLTYLKENHYAHWKFEGAEWKAKLRVENLTDSRYQEAIHFPAPGVFAMAGLEATF